MRSGWLCTVALVVIATSALAQTDLHDWNNVKNIAAGTDVWIKGAHGNVSGAIESVDDGMVRLLEWKRRPFIGGSYSRRRVIARSEVKQVRFAKRAVSALAGGALGVAAGAGIGAAIDAPHPNHEDRGIAMFVLGLFGGLIGESVGEHTAFVHGEKIYEAK